MFDLRGQVVEACPCGCNLWQLPWVMFEEGQIVAYSSDPMTCVACGTIAEPPMPGVNMEG